MKKFILAALFTVASLHAVDSEMITVFMRDQLFNQTPLRIDRNTTIKRLKQMLSDTIKIPVDQFVFVDKNMKDNETLASLNINNETMIRYNVVQSWGTGHKPAIVTAD